MVVESILYVNIPSCFLLERKLSSARSTFVFDDVIAVSVG